MKIWAYYMDSGQKIHRTENIQKGLQLWRKNLWHIENIIGKVRISTIFFGLDFSSGVYRKPYLFETAIFRGRDSEVIGKYKTLTEAKKGHAILLKELMSASGYKRKK